MSHFDLKAYLARYTGCDLEVESTYDDVLYSAGVLYLCELENAYWLVETVGDWFHTGKLNGPLFQAPHVFNYLASGTAPFEEPPTSAYGMWGDLSITFDRINAPSGGTLTARQRGFSKPLRTQIIPGVEMSGTGIEVIATPRFDGTWLLRLISEMPNANR